MILFEVQFFNLPPFIMFSKNRQEIWAKYPGQIKYINRIEII